MQSDFVQSWFDLLKSIILYKYLVESVFVVVLFVSVLMPFQFVKK